MNRLPLVEQSDPCEETTLASVGKPLLDHLDSSNAIEALPIGNRLLHQLKRIISHTVIVDQMAAAVNGLGVFHGTQWDSPNPQRRHYPGG